MCHIFPWNKPSFEQLLLRQLESEFQFSRYKNKTPWGILPKRYLSPLRNFQWVKNDTIRIARCAQPNYNGWEGDQSHEFNDRQLKFLIDNNIKTVISFNSKSLRLVSKLQLEQNNIEFHHFALADFTALDLDGHRAIDNIINTRYQLGAVLFYCGYGEGRTGTGIAGFILKYVLLHEPEILINLSGKQLHKLVTSGFGVEKAEQTNSIVNYLSSLATVEPEAESIRPRSLSTVQNVLFYDDPEEDQLQPLPSLPPTPPPVPPKVPSHILKRYPNYKPFNKPDGWRRPDPPAVLSSRDKVRMQSLDPVGNLRDGRQASFGAPAKTLSQGGSQSTLSQTFLSSKGHVNPNSFYFKGFDGL